MFSFSFFRQRRPYGHRRSHTRVSQENMCKICPSYRWGGLHRIRRQPWVKFALYSDFHAKPSMKCFAPVLLASSDEAIQEDLSQNFLNLQWLKMAASILMHFLFCFCLCLSSGYCCISAVVTTSWVCARDISASFTRPESFGLWCQERSAKRVDKFDGSYRRAADWFKKKICEVAPPGNNSHVFFCLAFTKNKRISSSPRIKTKFIGIRWKLRDK